MPETQRKNADACAVCERERKEKDIRLKPVKSNSFSFVAGSERPWYRHASVAFFLNPYPAPDGYKQNIYDSEMKSVKKKE